MASSTTEYSVTKAVVTLASQALCASEVSVDIQAEGFQYTCMGSTTPVQNALVSGTYGWSGSATVTYDESGEVDGIRGQAGALSVVITTSNTQTITWGGNIVITGVDASFSHGELPSATISFVGNGAFSEINTTPE